MKKLLPIGIAALSVLGASAAHADAQLPETMLGNWCLVVKASKPELEVYKRKTDSNGNPGPCPEESIFVERRGYSEFAAIYALSIC
jgi:hypothetical protein